MFLRLFALFRFYHFITVRKCRYKLKCCFFSSLHSITAAIIMTLESTMIDSKITKPWALYRFLILMVFICNYRASALNFKLHSNRLLKTRNLKIFGSEETMSTFISSTNFFDTSKKCIPSIRCSGTKLRSAVASDDNEADAEKYSLSAKTTTRKTIKKLLPLGAMLFFILFNYTILRDTKDVLVVTAPNSGAEIIPFLKTYVNLPSAVLFTLAYSSLCNKMSTDKVFYIVMSAFLSFFSAFAAFICKFDCIIHGEQYFITSFPNLPVRSK